MGKLARFIHFYTDEDDGNGGGGSSVLKTVKAALIHITDAIAKPAKKFVVNLEPVQSGSDDPSPDNIRTITGWTGATIYHRGKNLLNSVSENILNYSNSYKNYTFADGVVTITGNTLMGFKCQVKPNTKYYTSYFKSNTVDSISVRVREFSQEPTAWSSTGFIEQSVDFNIKNYNKCSTTFTTSATTNWLIFCVYRSGAPEQTLTISDWSIITGNAVEGNPYEPYVGTTYPITFPSEAGTVYGGTLDVMNGVLTVYSAYAELDGVNNLADSFAESGDSHGYSIQFNGVDNVTNYSTSVPQAISSHYVGQPYSKRGDRGYDLTIFITNANGRLRIRHDAFDSEAEPKNAFNAYLAQQYANGTPVQVVYKLKNSLTFTIDPIKVKTLLGLNNIWCDASDSLELTYYADGNVSESANP